MHMERRLIYDKSSIDCNTLVLFNYNADCEALPIGSRSKQNIKDETCHIVIIGTRL